MLSGRMLSGFAQLVPYGVNCAPCSCSFNFLPTPVRLHLKKHLHQSQKRVRWEHSCQNHTGALTCINFSQGYISSRSHKNLFNYLMVLVYICSQQLLIRFTQSNWTHACSRCMEIVLFLIQIKQYDKANIRFQWPNVLFS